VYALQHLDDGDEPPPPTKKKRHLRSITGGLGATGAMLALAGRKVWGWTASRPAALTAAGVMAATVTSLALLVGLPPRTVVNPPQGDAPSAAVPRGPRRHVKQPPSRHPGGSGTPSPSTPSLTAAAPPSPDGVTSEEVPPVGGGAGVGGGEASDPGVGAPTPPAVGPPVSSGPPVQTPPPTTTPPRQGGGVKVCLGVLILDVCVGVRV
jgi:hypothetical protein